MRLGQGKPTQKLLKKLLPVIQEQYPEDTIEELKIYPADPFYRRMDVASWECCFKINGRLTAMGYCWDTITEAIKGKNTLRVVKENQWMVLIYVDRG